MVDCCLNSSMFCAQWLACSLDTCMSSVPTLSICHTGERAGVKLPVSALGKQASTQTMLLLHTAGKQGVTHLQQISPINITYRCNRCSFSSMFWKCFIPQIDRYLIGLDNKSSCISQCKASKPDVITVG